MASSMVDHGSPLDDYFRDEETFGRSETIQGSLAGEDRSRSDNENGGDGDEECEGDETLVSISSSTKDLDRTDDMTGDPTKSQARWTGSVPNIAGPSTPPRAASRSLALSNDKISSTEPGERDDVDGFVGFAGATSNAFADRFKYLVCSSGILEKDYVPCLGMGAGSTGKDFSPTSDAEALDDTPHGESNARNGEGSNQSVTRLELVRRFVDPMVTFAIERKDLAVAALAMLIGLIILFGPLQVLLVLGVLGPAGGYGYSRYIGKPATAIISQPVTSSPDLDQDKQDNFPVSDAVHDTPLEALSTFLNTSQSLDRTIDTALTLLQPHSSDSAAHHSLRLALHRMTENMTDHFASAISNLGEMVDKGELAVLGGMYDIPLIGTGRALRGHDGELERNSHRSPGRDEFLPDGLEPARVSPAPRSSDGAYFTANSNTWSSGSAPHLSALPSMATSHTGPGRVNSAGKTKHAVHLSLSNLGGVDLNDKYTSFPVRTPRLSKGGTKRSSWAPEWSKGSGISSDLGASRRSWERGEGPSHAEGQQDDDTPSRPGNYRRITEAEEEDDGANYGQDEVLRPGPRIQHIASSNADAASKTKSQGEMEKVPMIAGDIDRKTPEIPSTPSLVAGLYTPRRSSPLRRRPSNSSNLDDFPKRHIMPIVPPTPPSSRPATISTPMRIRGHSDSNGGLLPSPFRPNQITTARRRPHSQAFESIPITLSLSSPVPNPKRRSLQNMPYYHTSTFDPISPGRARVPLSGGADLARTRSLQSQVSDLQALRTRSSSASLTASAALGGPDESITPARLHGRNPSYSRAESVSDTASTTHSNRYSYSSSLSVPDFNNISTNLEEHTEASCYPEYAGIQRQRQSASRTRPRASSISPLTLPGLKAACLGVHLKRRKVGCYLLGLRFPSPSNSSPDKAHGRQATGQEEDQLYWDDVQRVLRNLSEAINGELEVLREAEKISREEQLANLKRVEAETDLPPWMTVKNANLTMPGHGRGETDFAPRTADETILEERIKAIEAGLEATWRDLQSTKIALRTKSPRETSDERAQDLEEQPSVEAGWGQVRLNIGGMVREWERGKEVIARLQARASAARVGTQDSENPEAHQDHTVDPATSGLPNFVRAWQDEGSDMDRLPSSAGQEAAPGLAMRSASASSSSRSTSLRTDADGNSENLQGPVAQNGHKPEMTEDLPPPGLDDVFQYDLDTTSGNGNGNSQPAVGGKEWEKEMLKRMSREERISLAKEAREKGVAVSRLLAGRSGSDELQKRDEDDAQRRKRVAMEGEVVGELKGMIGMIRRRKGHEDEGDSRFGQTTNVNVGQGSPEGVVAQGRESTAQRDRESSGQRPGGSSKEEKGEVALPPAVDVDFRDELKRVFAFPQRESAEE